MMKKSVLFGVIFAILVCINVFLAYAMNRKTNQIKATNKVLNEIASQFDPKKQFNHSVAPLVLGAYQVNVDLSDGRAVNLRTFFRKHNSVLYDYSDYIVSISDKYQFDYRLLPAIAMQESNLCKYIPEDSNNCWGWGIYGAVTTKFDTYEEAIDTVARGIKREYIDKGLLTASAIMEKYTPSSSGSWAHGVNSFLRLLE